MEGLGLSHHAEVRARRRGFRHRDLDLVVEFGTPVREGFVLTGRDVQAFEAAVKQTLRSLRHLQGTFVVVAEDKVASVYRPDGPKLRRLIEEAHG